HSIPEFIYQVEHYQYGEQWGKYTFAALVRIWYILSGQDYDTMAIGNLTPRVGTYTTFFGPFYIDFGPLTPAVAILIGACVSWTRRQVLNGRVVALPLYTALSMQILASVVVCAVNSAYGIFYDLAFSGLWVGCIFFGIASSKKTVIRENRYRIP